MKKKWKIGVVLLMLMFFIMPVQAQAAGKVRALVISGNDLMWHKEGAQRFADALKDNRLPNYETSSGNIRTFYFHGTATAKGKGTTVDEFKAAIKSAYRNSTSKDLNIFYYSGHGSELKDGEHAVVLNKTTGIRFKNVAKELVKYKGKFIVIFNACYDGAFVTEGLSSLSKSERGRITCMTAVSDDIQSIGVLFPNSIFKGSGLDDNYLNLPADYNHDGMITTSEISSYAKAEHYYGNEQVLFHFESIDLKKSTHTLYDGDGYRTHTLEYDKIDNDPKIIADKNYVKWYTSDKEIATVDENGKVTAKKPGKVTITARYYGTLGRYYNAEDKCKITVKKPEIKISAVNSDILYVKGTKSLQAECKGTDAPITWASADKSIATVSSTGVVTGKKAGKVKITAKNKDAKATYTVTVRKPSITLSSTKLSVEVGKYKTLKATVKGPSQIVEWSSSNSSIATVDQNGKVTGKKGGKVTITAKANGVKATCAVTVIANYKDLYYEFLCKAQSSYSYKSGKYTYTDVARSYYLLHLNSDNIPELVVISENPGAFANICTFRVFTVKNNKVTYIGEASTRSGTNIIYNTKYKGLHTGGWINGIGGAFEILWNVRDGKFKEYKYSMDYFNSNGKHIYKTGTNANSAKKVSKSSIQSFNKKYFNKNNQKTYTMIKNTEANRQNSFK